MWFDARSVVKVLAQRPDRACRTTGFPAREHGRLAMAWMGTAAGPWMAAEDRLIFAEPRAIAAVEVGGIIQSTT